MKTFVISLPIVFALLYAGSFIGAAEPGLNIPVYTRTGLTANVGLGIEDAQSPFTSVQTGNTTTYTNDIYRIIISENANRTRSIVRVRVERLTGEAFRTNGFSVRIRVPKAAIQGIWYPSADPSSTDVMAADATESIDDMSDANYGIPYIAAASSNTRNAFALGLGRQDLSVSIGGSPVQNGYYEFRLKSLTVKTTALFDERFYVSTDASMTWFDTAANYADWVDALHKYQPFPIGPTAYEPAYDAWYWSGDRVDDRLYLETAKLASEVGAGLYLADSGWDAPAGEYDKWLNGRTGDYNPPPEKFGNLAATFQSIRSDYKLGIDLWSQPFAIGRASERYPRTRNMHIQIPVDNAPWMGWQGLAFAPFALPLGRNLETVNLCPRLSATQTYLKNLFQEMATKYKPDGYWLDFIDGMASYCVAPHTHNYESFGDGFRKALDAIKSTIRTNNPNAIVQFRSKYANLNTKSFANVWQSEDSPEDFDRMRLNSIRLRPFSKGVVFASDQMFWQEGLDDAKVSKFIMTSVMVGVPSFGPNLSWSPPQTFKILKAWLGFYRAYKTDLNTGRFSPFGQLAMPNHKIEGQGRTFAYIRNLDFSELPADGKAIFILNASDSDQFSGMVKGPADVMSYSVKVFNRYLEAQPNDMTVNVDSRGILQLNIAVEQGGMVVLSPADNS